MFNKPKWRQRSDTFNLQSMPSSRYRYIYKYRWRYKYVSLVFYGCGMQLKVVTTNWLCWKWVSA